jgi:hypothetical protein
MAARDTDVEAGDTIREHKQVADMMNQVYTNLYAISEDGRKNRYFGQQYASLEIILTNDIISFVIGVPKYYGEQVEKLIANFYP